MERKLATTFIICTALTLTNMVFADDTPVPSDRITNPDVGGASISPIQNQTIENNAGSDNGGGLYNNDTSAPLNVENTTVQNNTATNANGGGIYNSAEMTVKGNSQITGNTANGASAGNGGGIYNSSDLTVQNSNIESNSARQGGGLYNTGSTASTVENTTFTSNSATNNGGAIYNDGKLNIIGTSFESNSAQGNGGAIYNSNELSLENVTFVASSDPTKKNDIYNQGTMTVTSSSGQTNQFASNITNNKLSGFDTSLTFEGSNNIGGNIDNNAKIGFKGSNTISGDILNSGNLTFEGTNQITGGITNNSTLTLGGTNTVGDITNNNGAKVTLKDTQTLDGTLSNSGTAEITGTLKSSDSNAKIENSNKLTISGDVSNFNGKYTHNSASAETTVKNAFVKGEQEINQGTINWQTNSTQDLKLSVKGDATLNIGSQSSSPINLLADTGNITGTFVVDGGRTIEKSATVNVNEGSELKVTGGNATLNQNGASGDDTWNGKVTLESGDLTLDNVNSHDGSLNATGGNLTFGAGDDETHLTGNTNILKAGNGSTIPDDLIAKDVNLEINGTLNVSGGEITVDSNDSWSNAKINLTNSSTGTLKIDSIKDFTSDDVSKIVDDDSTNNPTLSFDHGKISASDGKVEFINSQYVIDTNSKIDTKAQISIDSDSYLLVQNGGELTLNYQSGAAPDGSEDDWQGSVLLNGGTLNLDHIKDTVDNTTHGGLSGVLGNLNITSSDLVIVAGSTIANTVDISFDEQSNIIVNGAQDFVLDSADDWKGTVQLLDGQLTLQDFKGAQANKNGVVTTEKGTLLLKNSEIAVGTGTSIAAETNLNIDKDSIVDMETGSSLTLDKDDLWEGEVKLTGGDLILDNVDAKGTSSTEHTGKFSADSGNLDIKGALSVLKDDVIGGNVVATIEDNSIVNVKGGNLTLDNNDTWDGKVISSAYVEGNSLTLNNINDDTKDRKGTLEVTLGNVDIVNSIINLKVKDKIAEGAAVNIDTNLTLTAKEGGSLTLNNSDDIKNNDTWNGKVVLDGGSISLKDIKEHNGSLDATKEGNLYIKGNTTLYAQDKITNNATTIIDSKDILNVAGANVEINNNDTWKGTIHQTDGSLKLTNVTSNGTLQAEKGDLELADSTITIGNNGYINKEVDYTMNEKTTLNIVGGSVTLDNTDGRNGTIVLNGDDANLTFIGVEPVSIPYDGVNPSFKLETINGNLTFDDCDVLVNGNVVIGEDTYFETVGENYVEITDKGVLSLIDCSISDDTKFYLTGEKVRDENGNLIDENGQIIDIDGNWSFKEDTIGGTLNYGIRGDSNPINLKADKGFLNLFSGSKLILAGGGGSSTVVENAVVVDIRENSELEITDDFPLRLDGGNENPEMDDKWSGRLTNTNSSAVISGLVNKPTASLVQVTDGAVTDITDGSKITLGKDTLITDGQVNLTNNSSLSMVDSSVIKGGTMTIDNTSVYNSQSNGFTVDTLTSSGLVNAINSGIEKYSIGNLNVGMEDYNNANFAIDIYARSGEKGFNDIDRFIAQQVNNNSNQEKAIINISDWKLVGDIYGWQAPIDRHIYYGNIFEFDEAAHPEIELIVTSKEQFTPIGWYQLNKNGSSYTLDLKRYNEQVFRGQVTTLAQYQNQLAITDMLFNHSMVLPGFKDNDPDIKNTSLINKIAATSPLFAPYQYSKKDGGVWFKSFGIFEKLQMTEGIKAGNNAYGTLVGLDLGQKELRRGWKFMPTVYLGYTGGHQTWENMSAYQNGGQVGFLGTWYKKNAILGALAYGGIYGNYMDVYNTTDNTFNYFGGAAAKASYNIRLHKDWVLQPNLLAAYNYFGEQNWHTTFGQMSMSSGMLNGINVAPGINLIWQKETFSTYLTLQYMYNLNGAVGGRAGNVSLPNLSMDRGYIQYGIGFTKNFTDRVSGYFQAVLRNAGRTGVGFQAGIDITLGKDPKEPNNGKMSKVKAKLGKETAEEEEPTTNLVNDKKTKKVKTTKVKFDKEAKKQLKSLTNTKPSKTKEPKAKNVKVKKEVQDIQKLNKETKKQTKALNKATKLEKAKEAKQNKAEKTKIKKTPKAKMQKASKTKIEKAPKAKKAAKVKTEKVKQPKVKKTKASNIVKPKKAEPAKVTISKK